MRKIIDLQSKIWDTDIENIEFDLQSRDEITQLLIGLQFVFVKRETREKVFTVLRRIVPINTDTQTGRPGMNLWKILVLGTIRLNCNWDFDKVHEIANNHRNVRLMLQHNEADWRRYGLQTIKDNLLLFTENILQEINKIVVGAGHRLIPKKDDVTLKGSCDSFVLKTDVHYPTDTNILYDAVRSMIRIIAMICSEIGVTYWRQSHNNILKVKGLLRELERLYRYKPKKESRKIERKHQTEQKTKSYLTTCNDFVLKVKETVSILRELDLLSVRHEIKLLEIEEYIQDAQRQIDQVERRIFKDEKIPHEEKVFSIFERHTEWINKGKAGVSQELGLRVCVLKDQHGFILHHKVMEKQTDDKIAVSIVKEAKEKFPRLNSCSFDKGFYTPDNKKELAKILDQVVLPKKGKLSDKEKEIARSPEYIFARKKHSAVESTISALNNHGLDRCLDCGLKGFKRYVGLAVLARNIQMIGCLIQKQQLKKLSRAA